MHDYTGRLGIEHAEIVVAQGTDAEWARDRSALWNAAEQAEKRSDARVAREFEIALPHELDADQRLAATRSFAQSLADRYGTAVDFAIHAPQGATDIRNHHAHLMMSVRAVGPEGFGAKTAIERENAWLLRNDQPTAAMQLREIRQAWEGIANERLAAAGLDMTIDHRSHRERGLELEPTEHMGIHATQMERRGLDVTRERLAGEAAARNAALIRDKPETVLTLVTGEKSVFDRHDVARALHRAIDDPERFRSAFATVMASPALVELQPEQTDGSGRVQLARYSTREMVAVEHGMAASAMRLAGTGSHGVEPGHVAAALAAQDAVLQREAGSPAVRLSDEQRGAVEHVTGAAGIAAVVGLAGAGKSTMLAAAKDAWERQGYAVQGAALSGKAAEGLEASSGIASRTLASLEHGWTAGRGTLGPNDVLVIDEAGMVGSRQLARFVAAAEEAGAKLVLVGDHEQLQAIGAGASFRAIAERTGVAELSEVRRQRADWQRAASQDLARHRTGEALAAYAEHGAVQLAATTEEARAALVDAYMADAAAEPEGSRLALAHRRVDVRALNAAIRSARQERGEIARGEEAGERRYVTNEGARSFAEGDRVVFLENNRDLGVKNGMLGTVTGVEDGRLTARLDGLDREGRERTVSVGEASYPAVDHGYATTIHKTQGATVDRAYVLASGTMDRHLTYVALTRHRDEAVLYAGQDAFRDMAGLAGRLSRDGSKEVTLDYPHGGQDAAQAYAERRGIAGLFGVESEIAVKGEAAAEVEGKATAAKPVRARSLFAGLKLGAGRERADEDAARDGRAVDGLRTGAERAAGIGVTDAAPEMLTATEGYARAFADALRMRDAGLPVLPHQTAAITKAESALDTVRPGTVRDLRSALWHDAETQRAMRDEAGPTRAAGLLAGVAREREAVKDPGVRAGRLVAQWQGLEAEHAGLRGFEHAEARGQLVERMRGVAAAIGKDGAAAAAIRQRGDALGVAPESALGRAVAREEGDLGEALSQSLDRGLRQRGQGMSM